jgi:predicted acylesterase/phospholipase RssA
MDTKRPNSGISTRRNKLGLALAGGGFRASLFHLGVLRRMAELDLLRSVEVLSTVSGGSIIGALYILLLKNKFSEIGPSLSQKHYEAIIEKLDNILVAGIKENLRTRLFMNPFELLRVLVSSYSLGKRMSRLYERYLYSSVVDKSQCVSWWSRLMRPGKTLLKDVLMLQGKVDGGIECYNRKAVASKGSVITSLVMNATSLNSGVPFRFSSVEIGDTRLGFLRYDETQELQKRKRLLDFDLKDLQDSLKKAPNSDKLAIKAIAYDRRTVSLVEWWKRIKTADKNRNPPPEWSSLYKVDGFPGCILSTEFGLLRDVKLAAWYVRIGSNKQPQVTGGLTPPEHMDLFWAGLRKIYYEQAVDPEKGFRNNPSLIDLLLDFILELYYLRSAEVMSKKIKEHWNSLSLGEAVGASACFPPLFAPYITHDFYDDWHVSRLGLTDGGVYDNVGLTTLFAERCNYIIASDTGGLFVAKRQSSGGRIGMSGRIVQILMNDVAETQREVMRGRSDAAKRIEDLVKAHHAPTAALTCKDLLGLAFFHIESPSILGAGLMPHIDRKLLALLRTDLDGFGDVEIAALVNHGYDTADQYIRRYLAGSPYENGAFWNQPPKLPKDINRSPEEINKILRVGKYRFFRALQLRALDSIIFTFVIFIAAVLVTWQIQLSLQEIITWMTKISFGWIESLISFLEKGWTKHKISVGISLLLVGAAIAVIFVFKLKLADSLKFFINTYLPWFRRLSTVLKLARSYSYNVAWISGFWPVVVSLIWSVLAWIDHLFFYLPFKRRTRCQ